MSGGPTNRCDYRWISVSPIKVERKDSFTTIGFVSDQSLIGRPVENLKRIVVQRQETDVRQSHEFREGQSGKTLSKRSQQETTYRITPDRQLLALSALATFAALKTA